MSEVKAVDWLWTQNGAAVNAFVYPPKVDGYFSEKGFAIEPLVPESALAAQREEVERLQESEHAIRSNCLSEVSRAIAAESRADILEADNARLREVVAGMVVRIDNYATEQEQNPIRIPTIRLETWAADLRAALAEKEGGR